MCYCRGNKGILLWFVASCVLFDLTPPTLFPHRTHDRWCLLYILTIHQVYQALALCNFYNDGEFVVCLKLPWIWSVWFSSKHFTVLEALTSYLTVGWIPLASRMKWKTRSTLMAVDGYCLLCLCGNLPRCHSSSLEYGVFFQLHVNAKFHISRKFIWIFEK